AFKSLETRLALGIDLAAVERLALVRLAQNFVRGIELGEAVRRLRVVLVGIRMQLLGELAVGALDLRRARVARHTQDVIGVAHYPPLRSCVFAFESGESPRITRW